MLIRDSLRHPSVPRVLQGVSSDSKNRNENILRTIAFPSSLPYPSISSLLLHLMKCCGKKSQFLLIPDGLSKPCLPRCRAWCGWLSPCITSQQHLPHHLLGIASSASPPSPSPLSSHAPGASAGRGREQRLPSSSLTASFHYLRDPLRASVSSSPGADPELPLSPACCSSSSFRAEAQRLLY